MPAALFLGLAWFGLRLAQGEEAEKTIAPSGVQVEAVR